MKRRVDIKNIQNLIIKSQKLDDAGYHIEAIAILEKIRQAFFSDKMVKTSATPFFSKTFWNNALREALGQLPKKNILYQWADSTPGLQLIKNIANTSDVNTIKQLTSHLGTITDAHAAQLAAAQNPIDVINTFNRMKITPDQLGMNTTELSPLSRLTGVGVGLAAGKSALDTINKTQRQKSQRGNTIENKPFSEEINEIYY